MFRTKPCVDAFGCNVLAAEIEQEIEEYPRPNTLWGSGAAAGTLPPIREPRDGHGNAAATRAD